MRDYGYGKLRPYSGKLYAPSTVDMFNALPDNKVSEGNECQGYSSNLGTLTPQNNCAVQKFPVKSEKKFVVCPNSLDRAFIAFRA